MQSLPNQFWKYHGRGNDFLLIEDQKKVFPLQEKILSSLCHRQLGVGADGVLLLQSSSKADYRMRIFNSDGKEARSCGNGLLCLLTFLQDQRLFLSSSLSIETFDRIVKAKKVSNGFCIDMGEAKEISLNRLSVIEGKSLLYHFLNTGCEHVVVFVKDLQNYPVLKQGKAIRYFEEFAPIGVNVNFVEKKGEQYHIRTYEKGVESETLACGTGACAVGVVNSLLKTQNHTRVVSKLGSLEIIYRDNKIYMTGQASYVYYGFLNPFLLKNS